MFERQYLMTPGPTPVPPEVLAASAAPIVHHRGPDFRLLYERCLDRLKQVWRTESDVLVMSASGTGAFESAVVNICGPGVRVLVISFGNFGERWIAMASAFGSQVSEIRYEWGEVPRPEDLRERLAQQEVDVVLLVHSETSTGVVSDLQGFADVTREASDALLVVDAVSSLGAVPVETDAWGIDVVVSGSQKALMCPPGLGLVSVSERALQAADENPTPRYYFDWHRIRDAQRKLDAAFTPPVSLLAALDVSLGMLLDEGLESVFDRHVRLGRGARAGVKALGLELFSADDDSSAVVTAARVPDGVSSSDLVLALRQGFGITIADGQGTAKGQIFRIGHIGWMNVFDVATVLSAVEALLAEEGVSVEPGAAVAACHRAYAAEPDAVAA